LKIPVTVTVCDIFDNPRIFDIMSGAEAALCYGSGTTNMMRLRFHYIAFIPVLRSRNRKEPHHFGGTGAAM
jgi:hypothetical protein